MASYLAAVQMDCIVGDIKQNTSHAIRLLENLLEKEPDIVLAVFPEMALYGYEKFEDLKRKYTQKEIDHALLTIAAVCKTNQVEVVIGAPYYHTSGIENALYYISDTGAIQQVYAKTHLIEAEQNCFQPGDTYSILETPLGKVGFLICWDSAFVEPARLYAKSGVDLLIVSAAWEAPYERQWELAVCGRSFDNSIPVLAANRVGEDGNCSFFGQSLITDCMGNICTDNIGNQEGFVITEWTEVSDARKREDFGTQIKELREDTYQMENIRFYPQGK